MGLVLWAKLRVVCSDTTSPAVASAVMKARRMAPIIRPVATSRITQPAMPPTLAGRAGSAGAAIGQTTRVISSASDSRMRGGT